MFIETQFYLNIQMNNSEIKNRRICDPPNQKGAVGQIYVFL